MKHSYKFVLFFCSMSLMFLFSDLRADAGMLLLTKSGKILDPDKISVLSRSVLNLGRGTGSFISDKGLILTNYHCAFDVINRVSSSGAEFYARTPGEEVPWRGLKAKMLLSYRDLSSDIVVSGNGYKEKRASADRIIAELEKKESDPARCIKAEIHESVPFESYQIYVYQEIKDIRLVYAPPAAIARFGGEKDNWTWPCHSADFALLRAYAAPDGTPAEYSPSNVPMKIKDFLKISTNGISADQTIFVLGYPGKTFRNEPSEEIEYQEDYTLPMKADLYDCLVGLLTEAAEDDDSSAVVYAPRLSSLSNQMKNCRGKLSGLERFNILDSKKSEEAALAASIKGSQELRAEYGLLFDRIDASYRKRFVKAEASLWMQEIFRQSGLVRAASWLIDNASGRKGLAGKDEIKADMSEIDESVESGLLSKMFKDALDFKEQSRIGAVDDFLGDADQDSVSSFVDNELLSTQIGDSSYFEAVSRMSLRDLMKQNDPLISFVNELMTQRDLMKEGQKEEAENLTELKAELIRLKNSQQKDGFSPDADGTMRLSYGTLKGFSPREAVEFASKTSIDGLIEKSYLSDEYQVPEKLMDLYDAGELGQMPLDILYNTDTSGGNSGSPVLNTSGRLVALNFDRPIESVTNDYEYRAGNTRSIGLDMRYMLFVLGRLSGAASILNELSVD